VRQPTDSANARCEGSSISFTHAAKELTMNNSYMHTEMASHRQADMIARADRDRMVREARTARRADRRATNSNRWYLKIFAGSTQPVRTPAILRPAI
jgi:hypothetical protein